MKKSLTLLGIGAGLLVGLTSCQSTKTSATGGYEEAVPMSELAIADGELPPWVLESDDVGQISAGETTAAARNNYAIPEPGESVASASQNQPATAAIPPTDDTVLEPGTFSEGGPVITHDPVVSTPKPAATPKPVAANTKPKSTGKGAKKPTKVDKPTLVVYKVRPGDNLSDIAKRSGTTVAQIRKDSGIKGDIIRPGQTIKVRYTPKGYVAPKGGNGTGAKAATAPVKGSYTVKAGDTISGIAKKNGISASALLAANGMTAADAAKLRAGRKLNIPGKASAPAAKKTTAKKATAKKKKK